MDLETLVTEYSTERRNIHQEMLYRNMQQCCGDCSAFFHAWAVLMGQRNLVGRSAQDYFYLDVPTFKRHVAACTLAMEEVDKVDACVEGLDRRWNHEGKNPADTRFTEGKTRNKTEEYRRLFNGETEWTRRLGCGDDTYTIQD